MTQAQKTALLKYLDDYLTEGGVGPRMAHVTAEDMLLAALGDPEVTAKWNEARNWWWYA